METYNNIEDARKAHNQSGGFLLDMSGIETIAGDCFAVTDDSPIEYRDFRTTREAVDYTLRLAKAGYDETKMGNGELFPICCPVCGGHWHTSLLAQVKEYRQLLVTLAMQGEETSLELEAVDHVIRKAENVSPYASDGCIELCLDHQGIDELKRLLRMVRWTFFDTTTTNKGEQR